MARVVRRKSAPVEGAYGVKFTEIIVIVLILAAIGAGLKYYFIDYRKSAAYALTQYFAYVKGGDIQGQYEMLDQKDKDNYMPTKSDYSHMFKQSNGFTERVVNVNIISPPTKPDATEVTLKATVDILANSAGKELYQAGSSKGFTDNYVMRKDSAGAWKLVLSKSGDGHGGLELLNAEPSPQSQF